MRYSIYCLGIFIVFLSGSRYPIDSKVVTTRERTIAVPKISGLRSTELCEISKYAQYGYGTWTFGAGLLSDQRTDLMPAGYVAPSLPKEQSF